MDLLLCLKVVHNSSGLVFSIFYTWPIHYQKDGDTVLKNTEYRNISEIQTFCTTASICIVIICLSQYLFWSSLHSWVMIQDHHALVTVCVEEKLRNTDMVSMFTTVEYVGPSNKILLHRIWYKSNIYTNVGTVLLMVCCFVPFCLAAYIHCTFGGHYHPCYLQSIQIL